MVASVRLLFVLLAFLMVVGFGADSTDTQAPVQSIETRESRWQGYLSTPAVLPVATPTPELMRVELTYYTCSAEERTAHCVTASGLAAGPGTIAHKSLPFGTVLIIAGKRYTVTDRGGGLREGDVDVWVESRAKAFQLGREEALVEVERGDSEAWKR